jgi:hypothetical protein
MYQLDDMSEQPSKEKGFFSTLPGIITSVAGLITAIGSLALILKNNDATSEAAVAGQYITAESESGEADQPAAQVDSVREAAVNFEPNTVEYKNKEIVYQIQEASAEILGDDVQLILKLECKNNSGYVYDLYANYLEAKVGGENFKVEPYRPSGDYQSIPANDSKVLEYRLTLPATTKTFSFHFWDGDDFIDSADVTIK